MKIAIIGFGGMAGHHNKYIIPRLNESDYPEKLEIAARMYMVWYFSKWRKNE